MSTPFIPTEDQRRTVKALAGVGVPHEAIAGYLDIDAKTLRKYFRQELDQGSLEANVKVAQTLFSMATVDRNVAAAIFWMKARGGWREKNHLEITGKDETPLAVTQVIYSWASDPTEDRPGPALLEGGATG